MLIVKTSTGDLRQYSFNAFQVTMIRFWQLCVRSTEQIGLRRGPEIDGNSHRPYSKIYLNRLVKELKLVGHC